MVSLSSTQLAAPMHPRSSLLPRLLAALALLVAASSTLPAQAPPRPRLAAAADTNDWEAYYDAGLALLRQRKQREAESYFYWSSRLDPSRAEPFFARWVTFWARDPRRYVRWWYGEDGEQDAPDARQVDTLRELATMRNPLVFQGLRVMIVDQLPGDWGDDPVTRAILAYGRLQFDRASTTLANFVARDPEKHAWARYYRALVFTAQERYDSAATEMDALVATLRANDAKQIQYEYFSKAFPEYAVGRLLAARGDVAGAQAAFGRSLSEDLSFAPSHEWMAQLALGRGDAETATHELQQAVELRGGDGVLRWELGRALAANGQDEAAIEQLRQAVTLEPWFADPYFSLALAYDRRGRTDDAVRAYRDYLARATRSAPTAPKASARLAQLTAR